jgi:hypothetical protein
VRSAYHTEREHQHGAKIRRHDGQDQLEKKSCLGYFMDPKSASKGQDFAWRALHGLVPGVGVLPNRHIMVSLECPICKQGCEDICT